MAESSSFTNSFIEWLPGAIAGLLPLSGFFLAHGDGSGLAPGVWERGLASHLLVVAIVASSVSVMTSFMRLAAGNHPNFMRDGRGPIFLLLILMCISFYSTVVYTLVEAHTARLPVQLCAWLAVVTALIASLAMEFAMTRLRLLSEHPDRQTAATV